MHMSVVSTVVIYVYCVVNCSLALVVPWFGFVHTGTPGRFIEWCLTITALID